MTLLLSQRDRSSSPLQRRWAQPQSSSGQMELAK
jgi:hypothetical protein